MTKDDMEFEEVEKEEKKKSKVLIVLLAILLVLVLAVVAIYTSVVLSLKEGTVEKVDKEDITQEALLSQNVPIITEEQIKSHVFNILLIGIDTKDANSFSGRSDTMMLVSYNEFENKASIVSFMRDSLVEVPGYGKTKLGHSYAYGGVGLTINTINEVYDLDIQNYVTINFENMKNVIDKMGGIEVPLTAEEAAYLNRVRKTNFVEGVNVMNGQEALWHARNRSLDNDFGRTRRQRSVMNGIYRKVMETKSPESLTALITYCLTQVKTNMDMSTISDMAFKVLSKDNLTVQQTSVPAAGTYQSETYEGMSVLTVDIDENKRILREYLY